MLRINLLFQGNIVGTLPDSMGPFVLIHQRREIKLAKILCGVMGVFFACWLPMTSLFVYDLLNRSEIVSMENGLRISFDLCLIPAMIHPLVNPIIYSLKMPRMWSTLR